MSYIGNQPSQVAFLTDTFSGTGSATAFTMSVAPANPASILVAISGVLQAPSVYSVSGTTLTFSSAPASGTGNISVRYLGIPASGVTSTAYRTVTEFTATSGQTTFTPPSYTVGFINVYQNGARLAAADYTATNGTTVVLNTGATTNDLVTVESFLVSSVLNAIPATAGSVQSSYIQPSPTLTTPVFSGNTNMTGGTKYQVGGITTNALAWVSIAGGSSPTIRSNYNVSSITRNSAGDYSISFTNATSDANYSAVATSSLNSSNNYTYIEMYSSASTSVAPTTSGFRIGTNSNTDAVYYNIVVFGN